LLKPTLCENWTAELVMTECGLTSFDFKLKDWTLPAYGHRKDKEKNDLLSDM
jgi:hypothetical protein